MTARVRVKPAVLAGLAVLLTMTACGGSDPDPPRSFSSRAVTTVHDLPEGRLPVVMDGRSAHVGFGHQLRILDLEKGEWAASLSAKSPVLPEQGRATTPLLIQGNSEDGAERTVLMAFRVQAPGSGNGERQGVEVAAADPDSGDLRWRLQVEASGTVGSPRFLGSHGGLAVLEVPDSGQDSPAATLFGIDLGKQRVGWELSARKGGEMTGDRVITTAVTERQQRALTAVSAMDGTVLWEQEPSATGAARAAVGQDKVLVSRRENGGETYRVLDTADGTVLHTYREEFEELLTLTRECYDDELSVVVCADGFGAVVALDHGTGEVLWHRAEGLAVRAAWRGLVYGRDDKLKSVAVDGRTGEHRKTDLGVLPDLVNQYAAFSRDGSSPLMPSRGVGIHLAE
ncbi:PQQ-binding-like beta-propeller repeat protein [Streptomyces sp. ACA25]|uniref:outer membrane protein assembly factor BamB family protein n=1 Tax=Streptomyces sp. ACA25 TaxID=3022596 RepID=UPI0023078BB1|nr:PQQ-binding-like beta-propeller repeat protein [Streptomyces sp. ACA25]MDB1090005.1 PQQ-binding-like beta-propeller repeat protein [Streptomyces sp. ACA25]